MANPQKENGHTRLANEILEAMMTDEEYNISARIIYWIFRNTYGWNRKSTNFSWAKIAREIGARREHVSRAGLRLIEKKRIFVDGEKIGFQKNHEKWEKRTIKGSPSRCAPSKTTTAPKMVQEPHHQRQPTAPFSHHSSNAREKTLKKEKKGGNKERPPHTDSGKTPNWKDPSTVTLLAQYGWPMDPKEHPGYYVDDNWRLQKFLDTAYEEHQGELIAQQMRDKAKAVAAEMRGK